METLGGWLVSGVNQSGVPPSGGSLEIGNTIEEGYADGVIEYVPPSGGSLEIGNPRG